MLGETESLFSSANRCSTHGQCISSWMISPLLSTWVQTPTVC